MSTVTQLTTVPADLIGAQVSPPPSSSTTTAPSKSSSKAGPSVSEASGNPAASAQRLVIKEGAQAGVLIYTILDRATGEVLVQLPREEVVRIASRPDYSAGQVINTKV